MATIAWTDEARRWLEDIFEYIAADNPHADARTVQEIYERAQVLATFPEIGHRYVASSRNVRILLYGHYRIAYLVKDDGNIDVLGVPRFARCHEVSTLMAHNRVIDSDTSQAPLPALARACHRGCRVAK